MTEYEFQDVWTKPGSNTYHTYKDCGYISGGYVVNTHTQVKSRGKSLCEYCEKRLLDEREIGEGT